MCISETVSFGMGGLLVSGGVFAVHKAYISDRRYLPLSLFPVLVGIQQIAEGLVWTGANLGLPALEQTAALSYLFFVWMVWPAWAPYMTAQLENDAEKKKLFLQIAQMGFILGAVLYLPNFWQPDWLNIEIINHSIAYQCVLLPDFIMPREIMAVFYLSLIGLPPLLSSHRPLNFFGAGLIAAVPITYFLFSYAHISVLCFFAALMTLYILYIIIGDRCAHAETPLEA